MEPLTAQFVDQFGTLPAVQVRAPGRVNLIGDHTDYNEGWALPVAIDASVLVAARVRQDGWLHSISETLGAADRVALAQLHPANDAPQWARYVRGMAAMLLEAGIPLTGADLLIRSTLPMGAGLSSSAALTMGVATALLALHGHTLPPTTLARLGQRVEHEWIGLQSGLLDQMAVLAGQAGHATLLDCRTLATRPVALPADLRLLIIESGVPRTLAAAGYNTRRAECEAARAHIQQQYPTIASLRDITPMVIARLYPPLPAPLDQRVTHVVSENERVLACAVALEQGDLAQAGALLNASHASLRDKYESSAPDVDRLVALAQQDAQVLGARITGGGFGGCVVALVPQADAAACADRITQAYTTQTGRQAHSLIAHASAGVQVLG